MTTQLPTLGTSDRFGYKPASSPAAPAPTTPAGQPTVSSPAAPAPAPTAATSTPGAAASVAAPDTSALGQDPAYLAYLRGMGISDTSHSVAIQRQIDALNQNVALRLPQMQQDAAYANKNLLGGMESRGLLNSGETENRLSHEQMLEQRQQAALTDQSAQKVKDLLFSLAQFRANQNVGATEKGLTAGTNVATSGGDNQISTDALNAAAALGM